MNYQKVMDYQRKRLIDLIKEVSDLNGGDDPAFLDEYIAEVLKEWSNKLHTAIACFEDLKAQALARDSRNSPKREPQEKREPREFSKGHPAFRKHYDDLAGKEG